MRRWPTAALLGGLLTGHPSLAQDAPRPAPAPTTQARAEGPRPAPDADPDALLAAWAGRAATRASLQVAFERVDKYPDRGDKVSAGRAYFRGPDLCVESAMARTDPGGKPRRREVEGRSVLEVEPQPAERFVLTPKAIVQYQWDIRTIYRYPLPGGFMVQAADRARWFCGLPFLFGRTAAEVKARHAITILPIRDPAQAAKFHLLRIVPRQEMDRMVFRDAYIYLDRQTFLPHRLVLIPPSGQGMQDFRFTAIRVNEPIPDQVFATDPAPEGWKIVNGDQTGKGDGPSADGLFQLVQKVGAVYWNPVRLIGLLPKKQDQAP